MKGQRTPAQHLDALAALTNDLTSAMRIRQNQLSGDDQDGTGVQAPASRLAITPQSGSTTQAPASMPVQTPPFRESAGAQRRVSERLNKSLSAIDPDDRRISDRLQNLRVNDVQSSSTIDPGDRRSSKRLQNLRLNFENQKGNLTDSRSSSSVMDEDGNPAPSSITSARKMMPPSAVPPTALRKNVTKRRSNGRARDSIGTTSVPISKLLERVPKGREQDEAYARETRISPQESRLISPGIHTDAVSYAAKPQSSSSPDFTRKAIPTEFESPTLHRKLRNMWIRKKRVSKKIWRMPWMKEKKLNITFMLSNMLL